MKDFQNHKKNKLAHSLPFVIILFIVLVFFAVSVSGFAKRAKEAYENRKISESKISELEDRKNALEKDIEELNTDFGKEKIFRENYGLGRPGEGVVVVVDDTKKEPENKPKSGFINFFTNLFSQ